MSNKFPELNIVFLETGEGDLLKDNDKRRHQADYADDVTEAISAVRDEIVQYQLQSERLKGMQLPPAAALELLRSSIKLIQAYIDAVEEVNKRQTDDDHEKP